MNEQSVIQTDLYKKLLNIQNSLKAPKGQFNKFGNYAYRSCEDILEAVKPLLNQQNITLILSDEPVLIGERYYIKATCTLTDGINTVNSTAFARESETKKGMDESQITGAASSYARKYALNGMFCIDDTKDADSTNKHGANEPEPINSVDFAKEIQAVKTLAQLVKLFNSNQAAINGNSELLNAFKTKKAELLKAKGEA